MSSEVVARRLARGTSEEMTRCTFCGTIESKER